jgi:transcription-repair coupling factor (superfamily II helicase)
MATLAALASGFDTPMVILTTLAAISQYIPNRQTVSNNSFVATVGRNINPNRIKVVFYKNGFSSNLQLSQNLEIMQSVGV